MAITSQEEAKRMEGCRTRLAALQHRSADLRKRIRELGAVPMDEVDSVRGTSLSGLKKLLARVQGELGSHTCASCAARPHSSAFRTHC